MLGHEEGLPNLVILRSGLILWRNTWARLVLGAEKKRERVMPKYLSIKHTIITFFLRFGVSFRRAEGTWRLHLHPV